MESIDTRIEICLSFKQGDVYMNIGSMIMSKRKALGYTQQTLADKLNVSFQAVSKWENGTNYPEMEMLPMIASVLDTSIDSFRRIKIPIGFAGIPENFLCSIMIGNCIRQKKSFLTAIAVESHINIVWIL